MAAAAAAAAAAVAEHDCSSQGKCAVWSSSSTQLGLPHEPTKQIKR